MTYEHFVPPSVSVQIDSLEFPLKMAEQLLIAGWNNNFSGVMYHLSSLSIYRECVYENDLEYPTQYTTVESVLNFSQKHPMPHLNADKDIIAAYKKDLCIRLLDHIRFFKNIHECVGIDDD
jgi:hypothetical protein